MQKGRQEIRTGMEVEVYQKIKEWNKERIQRFKGIVIKTVWKTELEKTITVRRKVGAFGVERVFAVHSSTIEKIEILRQFKVRRKSIKFIRDLTGKAARLKEVPLKNVKEIEVPEVKEASKAVEENTNNVETTEKVEEKKETDKTPTEDKEEKVEEVKQEESKEEAPKEEKKKEEKTEK